MLNANVDDVEEKDHILWWSGFVRE